MICLSAAIASMGRAMQRQADNRHHLIAQVKSFPFATLDLVLLTVGPNARQWHS